MLWQYIIDRYLLYLVKERKTIQCLPVNEISSEDLRLTAVDENTLRYEVDTFHTHYDRSILNWKMVLQIEQFCQ